jgi:UDP-N-acetylglucosamine 2-epimerase (non-hydrolysing)
MIASGQNDIVHSKILQKIDCGQVQLELSKESDIRKSAAGLLRWWGHTYKNAARKIRDCFKDTDFEKSYMIVHGDTVSTYMGARIGKKLGMSVCHVEAGLRSHNIFNPFPEEIDRLLTSQIARMHFAPGEEAAKNLKSAKGKIINTKQNTLLDSLRFSYSVPVEGNITQIIQEDYFVFVMHRQENLANRILVCAVVEQIVTAAKERKCVIILHQITKNTLQSMNLLHSLEENSNIVMLPRVDYFDFMKLLYHAKFVITDGGSNQEELYYMGKPCLIMRKTTERNEGLGQNAKLYGGETSEIGEFIASYEKYIRPEISSEVCPTKMIVDSLVEGE